VILLPAANGLDNSARTRSPFHSGHRETSDHSRQMASGDAVVSTLCSVDHIVSSFPLQPILFISTKMMRRGHGTTTGVDTCPGGEVAHCQGVPSTIVQRSSTPRSRCLTLAAWVMATATE
jgi:hypothetical protein